MAAAFVATRWDKPATTTAWRPLAYTSVPKAPPPAAVSPAPPPAAPVPPPTVGEGMPPGAAEVEPGPDHAAEIARLGEALDAARAEADRARSERDAVTAELEKARQVVEVEAERVRALVEGLTAARRRLVDEVREAAGVLVLAGARKLAGEGLRVQTGLVEALVNDAVGTLGREGLVVRVNPGDVERVARVLEGSGAQIVPDTSIEAGCHAATPYGSVDATLQTAAGALKVVVEQWQTAGWRTEDDA